MPTAPAPKGPRELRALLQRLQRWLARHRQRFLTGLCPGASRAELDALQEQLALPLPDELRLLLAWHDGQGEEFVGRFEQDWLLMSAAQIGEAKAQLDADAAATGWSASWIPFLDDDAGDYVCLDTTQPGAPVREFWPGTTDHAVVAPSLTAWLRMFVTNLEQGKYVEDPERGTLMRTE
jgi:cell wall assembly regulator SMI1